MGTEAEASRVTGSRLTTAFYFAGPAGGLGRGEDPPRPSSMPIDVEGGLICSGGRGLGTMLSVYRQCCKPGKRLHDHECCECA